MKQLKVIISFSIILGMIYISLGLIFGMEMSFISTKVYNGVTIRVFDYNKYFQNISTALGHYQDLSLNLPTFKFDGADIGKIIGNSCISICNGIITGVNILLYPLRIGGYIVFNYCALMGMNVYGTDNGGLQWVIDFANGMTTGKLSNIPYIPYWE